MEILIKDPTVQDVACRFQELAKQEKWFDIQEELFADDIKSIEPVDSPWFKNEEGKMAVRKKGEDWVKRIEAVYHRSTTPPMICGNHFVVGREVDISVKDLGRILIKELMLYKVENGKIILEQFFY